jgi:thioesterase domain-containing protein
VPYLLFKFRLILKLWERGREMRKTPCAHEPAGAPAAASPKRVLWGTIRIWGKYVPQPYAGKLYLFLSEEADLAGVGQRVDPRYGWTRLCSSYEVIHLEGEHVQMLEQPLVNRFAEVFARCLAESQAKVASPEAQSMTA